jgi:hypothetical protein
MRSIGRRSRQLDTATNLSLSGVAKAVENFNE